MSVIENLVSTARADVELLQLRDSQGDVFSSRRAVDFTFLAAEEKQAKVVAGFLADYQYASTVLTQQDGTYRVVATISMPIEQQVILAVSGFMQCIGALFQVTYDGWGAVIKPNPM